MYEYAIAWEWLAFAVRWLHVITAIAWIGSSFYFVALDLGLRKRADLPAGAHGEEWQVHGGGFYHIQKYLVAPANMPEHLTWFKWESYVTWLSGFGMLCLVYYGGADLYLIDPNVLDVSKPDGDRHLACLARLRLDHLRPALQVAARQRQLAADGASLYCHPGRAWPGAIRSSSPAAPPSCISAPSPRRSCRPTSSSSSCRTRDRRRRPDRRAHAGREIRQDRQAALAAQQLPDAAGHLLHAVEPLSAGVRHRSSTGSSPRWSS